MNSFAVDKYKVRLEVKRVGNPVDTQRTRLIELQSQPMAHGIVTRVSIAFASPFDSWSNSAAVGFLNTSNPSTPVISGWLPTSEFEHWYEVLRAEEPITFAYNVNPIGGASYIDTISIGTTNLEPLGEGPRDF